jgi:uncharacterized membrane protein YoaK (UPF0700 family)
VKTAPEAGILTPVLFGLTAVTGLIDAVSYLALGHVFTANMTGNVVFLGFAAAGAPGLSVARSGAALLAFLMGAVIGGRMALHMGSGPRYRWTGTAFGMEAALLLAAMALALRSRDGAAIDAPHLYAVIGLTGLAMGVRNATVRKLGVPDLTTTVLTLTITGLAADSRLAGGSSVGRAKGFSAAVLRAVEAVTKREGENYDHFVARAAADPIGRRVKLADLEDNSDLGRIRNPTAKDQARIEKYQRAIRTIRDRDRQES